MQVNVLTAFFRLIEEDNCISTSHISVYVALFHLWMENDFQNPFFISRQVVMKAAKINGLATYHRCMKDLHRLQYIRYLPSYHPGKKTKVIIIGEEMQ